MAETVRGYAAERGDGVGDWIRLLDDGLIWLRPAWRNANRAPGGPHHGLEQKLADLHARYERACIED